MSNFHAHTLQIGKVTSTVNCQESQLCGTTLTQELKSITNSISAVQS